MNKWRSLNLLSHYHPHILLVNGSVALSRMALRLNKNLLFATPPRDLRQNGSKKNTKPLENLGVAFKNNSLGLWRERVLYYQIRWSEAHDVLEHSSAKKKTPGRRALRATSPPIPSQHTKPNCQRLRPAVQSTHTSNVNQKCTILYLFLIIKIK